MKNDIELFFSSFHSYLEVKAYIKNKTEIVFLYEKDVGKFKPIKSWFAEEGYALVEFHHDAYFNQITDFLLETCTMLHKIKKEPNNLELWRPFYNLAIMLINNYKLHPLYYSLLAEIVNAYKRKACDENGALLDDNYFFIYAKKYLNLKIKSNSMIQCCFDRNIASGSALDFYQKHNLHQDYLLSSVYIEMIPDTPYSEDQKMGYVPCFVIHPNNPEDLWSYWIKEYIDANVIIKRCEKCSKYFVATGRSNVKYCDRIFENTEKTCRQLMPKIILKEKTEHHVAEKLFSRAYKTMYSRVSMGTMAKNDFKEWSKLARKERNACLNGMISPEEFSAWLCDSGLFIDYLVDELQTVHKLL